MIILTRRLVLIAATALAVSAGAAVAHKYRSANLEIEHPWSRATSKTAKVGAGYVIIKNNGSEPDKLLAATSEISEKTELHETVIKDNIASMRALPTGVTIPAKGSVEFGPGGMHIMFVGLKRALKEGEFFKGTLTFEKAGAIDVRFAIEEKEPAGKSHQHHNH